MKLPNGCLTHQLVEGAR